MPAKHVPDIVMGLEQEYGFSVIDDNGSRMSNHRALKSFFRFVRTVDWLPHLPGEQEIDLYTAGGFRLYPDVGHIEIALPECRSPREVAVYKRAADRLVETLVRTFAEVTPEVSKATVFTNAVSYPGGRRSNLPTTLDLRPPGSLITWGIHENIAMLVNPAAELKDAMLPYLCSRNMFAAGGGISLSEPGALFVHSPRLESFRTVIGGGTTTLGGRSLLNIKDEPHGENCRRVHLVCCDNVQTDLGLILRSGSCALVVRMAELGLLECVAEKRPYETIVALRNWLKDPHRQVPLRGGGLATAFDIQNFYVERCWEHRDKLPDWAEELIELWAESLTALQHNPESLAEALDIPMKRRIMDDYIRAHSSLDFESLQQWSRVLPPVIRDVSALMGEDTKKIFLANLLTLQSNVGSERFPLLHYLDDKGLSATPEEAVEKLEEVMRLKPNLHWIDTAFSFLSPDGILRSLEDDGLVRRYTAEDDVARALTEPPPGTRAARRGKLIAQYAGRDHFTARWDRILGLENETAVGIRMNDVLDREPADDTLRPIQFDRNDIDAFPARLRQHIHVEDRTRDAPDLELHRRIAQRLRSSRLNYAEFAMHDPVRIRRAPCERARPAVGRIAIVVDVDCDDEGVFYELDLHEDIPSDRQPRYRNRDLVCIEEDIPF